MTITSRETVDAFFLALSEGRRAEVLSLLSPEVSWWVGGSVPGLSGTRVGDEVRTLLTNVLELTVDGCLGVEPRSWIVEGNHVAVEAVVGATLATSAEYRNEYHFAVSVDRGRIASVRAYLDTEHLRDVFSAPLA